MQMVSLRIAFNRCDDEDRGGSIYYVRFSLYKRSSNIEYESLCMRIDFKWGRQYFM